jgi:hypothetical protein
MMRTTTTEPGKTRYQVRRRDAQIPMLAALWEGPEVGRGIPTEHRSSVRVPRVSLDSMHAPSPRCMAEPDG